MIPEQQELHQMVTEYEHNGTYWIVCPTCGRHVILLGGELAIIESGD